MLRALMHQGNSMQEQMGNGSREMKIIRKLNTKAQNRNECLQWVY